MTRSTSAAMALRRVNSGRSKMVRMRALGEEVLDEHVVHGLLADIGVE